MTQKNFRTDGAKITAYLVGPEWDGARTAAIGDFTCKTLQSGAIVLSQALSYIRYNGIERVIGPMDGDTWHSYRFVTQTDDSDGFLLEPKDMPDGLKVFRDVGFAPISSYFSARVPLAQTALRAPPPTDAFTIEPWDGTQPEALFTQVFDLSCQAFSKNAFYTPISQEAFLAMYMPLVPMLKPELIFFARRSDQSLAGFLFGIPNYSEGLKPSSVILKTYASLEPGAGQHLAYTFHKAAARDGYKTAIHALIHDDNLSALRSASEGADIFRRYGLFGLMLDD